MLDFKSFRATEYVLADVELMHLNCKGQFLINGVSKSFAEQFIRWQDNSVDRTTLDTEIHLPILSNAIKSDRDYWHVLRVREQVTDPACTPLSQAEVETTCRTDIRGLRIGFRCINIFFSTGCMGAADNIINAGRHQITQLFSSKRVIKNAT